MKFFLVWLPLFIILLVFGWLALLMKADLSIFLS